MRFCSKVQANVQALLTAQAVKMLSVPLWLRCGDDFVSQ